MKPQRVETVIDKQSSLISKHSEEMVKVIFDKIFSIEEKVQQLVKENRQLQSRELVNLGDNIEKHITGISDKIKKLVSRFSQDIVLEKIESTNCLLKDYHTKKTSLELQIEELISRNAGIELQKTGHWEKIENLQLKINEKEPEHNTNRNEISKKIAPKEKQHALVCHMFCF